MAVSEYVLKTMQDSMVRERENSYNLPVEIDFDKTNFLLVDAYHILELAHEINRKRDALYRDLLESREARTYYTVIAPILDFEARYRPAESLLWVFLELAPKERRQKAAFRAMKLLDENKIYYLASEKHSKILKDYINTNYLSEKQRLTTEQQRSVEVFFSEYHRNRISSEDENSWEHTREVLEKIYKLSADVNQNISQDTTSVVLNQEELAGCLLESFEKYRKDDVFHIPLTYPEYETIVGNCTVSETRKAYNKRYVERYCNEKNKVLLQEILVERQNLARLLGYPNYAEYKLHSQMAAHPDRAQFFLNNLKDYFLKLKNQDIAELEKFGRRYFENEQYIFKDYDFKFLHNKFIYERYAIDLEELRKYFPIEQIIQGTFTIFGHLFEITFEEVCMRDGAVWHDSVRCFRVTDNTIEDEDRKKIGYLYLDLFSRPRKYPHICVQPIIFRSETCREGRVVMVCNFAEDKGLSISNITDYLHEFGHVMQVFLSRNAIPLMNGLSVEYDFVEATSQMFEFFATATECLKIFSKNLSTHMVHAIQQARYVHVGYKYLMQVVYAHFDLMVHRLSQYDLMHNSIDTIFNDILEMYYQEDTESLASSLVFEHIVNEEYASCYYGYAWAMTIAGDMFQKFEKNPLDKNIGLRYRTQVLAPGASLPAARTIENFLGRDFDPFALVHLIRRERGSLDNPDTEEVKTEFQASYQNSQSHNAYEDRLLKDIIGTTYTL